MKRLLLTIAYEGTQYHGWQLQTNALTVQEVVEKAATKLLAQPVRLTAASRTDAGVHAHGQRASMLVETSIPSENVPLALNGFLPNDVRIMACQEVDKSFHPRFHAQKKRYTYTIMNTPLPDVLLRNYAWHIKKPLDVQLINRAASLIDGKHDFASFCAAGSSITSTVRTVYQAQIKCHGDSKIVFSITGDGFLYKMIRILVGTLVDIGLGKYPPHAMLKILQGRNRELAGPTAPAQGLILEKIWYT